jgi:hypothetical protein
MQARFVQGAGMRTFCPLGCTISLPFQGHGCSLCACVCESGGGE